MKFVFLLILLFFVNSGCLAKYGESRLNHLLLSVKDLEKKCEDNNEKLSESGIREKLGEPGWLKPVYENYLDFTFLEKLQKDSGVLLEPNQEDIYKVMIIDRDEKKLKSVKLLSYIYDRMGRNDPSLTFYIGNYVDSHENESRVIGWDYVKHGDSHQSMGKERDKVFVNYKIDKPADLLRVSYTFLVDSVIGLKQFVGEVIKSPISFVEAEFLKNTLSEKKIPFYKFDGFKAAIEDWRNGIVALTYRHRVDGKQGILRTTQNLLGEIPIIGPVFDQWHRGESVSAEKLFLTRGIYGGNNSAQNTVLWVNYFTKKNETDDFYVKAIPYRYGSYIDIIWSLLNISHGYAYDMASEIVLSNNVSPGDSIHLSGHSGGIQRIVSAARILNDDGIRIGKMFGIAGPALGHAPCSEIEVELNDRIFQDSTSDLSRLLNFITLNLLTNINWKHVEGVGERHKHRTPGFVDGRTRLKYDGFLSKYLKDYFR